MFINTGKFKKMLKSAYNSCGLLMSREGDSLLLCGGSFVIHTNIKEMTKKEKAAVIELVGKFPDDYETFRANKGGEQQELRMPETWGIPALFEEADKDYKETYVLVDAGIARVRAIQNKKSNAVLWFDESLLSAIYLAAMQDFEEPPAGPRISDNKAIWQNNICTYAILKYDLKNAEFSRLLENMELFECKSKT